MTICCKSFRTTLTFAICVLAMSPVASRAQSEQSEWQYRATIYGWFPRLDGTTQFSSGAGGPSIGVDAGDLISNLKMGFMGAFSVQRGQWGVFADLFYADVGDTKTSNSVGNVGLPITTTADVSLDVKTTIFTLAGTYALVQKPEYTVDVLFGTRVLRIKQTLDYAISKSLGPIALPGTSGRAEASTTNWDAIVGASGRFRFGEGLHWFVPYYLDLGTGNSQFTWQAIGGLGYSFAWGDVVAAWRYTDYEFKSGALQSLTLQGPAVGVSFSF